MSKLCCNPPQKGFRKRKLKRRKEQTGKKKMDKKKKKQINKEELETPMKITISGSLL